MQSVGLHQPRSATAYAREAAGILFGSMSGSGKSAAVQETPGEERTVPPVRRTDGLAGITAPEQSQPAVLYPVSGVFPGAPPEKERTRQLSGFFLLRKCQFISNPGRYDHEYNNTTIG